MVLQVYYSFMRELKYTNYIHCYTKICYTFLIAFFIIVCDYYWSKLFEPITIKYGLWWLFFPSDQDINRVFFLLNTEFDCMSLI